MVKLIFPRNNNLDWLRLIFATQVVLHVLAVYLGKTIPKILAFFPGVPVFFFVSGFLVYASYLNAPGRQYFKNRFLRLYPGLVLVALGGVAVVLIAHGWRSFFDNFSLFVVWFFAQITLGQAYNPSLFRDIGVGVINGALWTITTEIIFYLSVPVIVWMEGRFRFTVVVLIVLSFLTYSVGPLLFTDYIYREKTLYNFIELTPIAWGWMFGLGILALKYFDYVRRWLRYFPLAIIPLAIMIFLGDGLLFEPKGNRLGLAYFLCYSCLVLWLAFKVPYVRLPLDLSYGVYIWHAPIVNLCLVLGISNTPLVLALIFAIAGLSWFLVESPILKLKSKSLKYNKNSKTST